jgi:hypothetical protein
VREGNEVQINGQQHQFQRHQQNNDVLAIQENANHANSKQDGSQH